MLIVDAPHYYAAIIFQGMIAVKAAPIVKWAIGKHAKDIIPYLKRKGYKLTLIP